MSDELFTPAKTSVDTFHSPSNTNFEVSHAMVSRHVLLIYLHSGRVSGCLTFKRKGCAGSVQAAVITKTVCVKLN